MGCSGSLAWLAWLGDRWGLVQHSWFLETSSDMGLLGQAAGNGGDQGRTFA